MVFVEPQCSARVEIMRVAGVCCRYNRDRRYNDDSRARVNEHEGFRGDGQHLVALLNHTVPFPARDVLAALDALGFRQESLFDAVFRQVKFKDTHEIRPEQVFLSIRALAGKNFGGPSHASGNEAVHGLLHPTEHFASKLRLVLNVTHGVLVNRTISGDSNPDGTVLNDAPVLEHSGSERLSGGRVGLQARHYLAVAAGKSALRPCRALRVRSVLLFRPGCPPSRRRCAQRRGVGVLGSCSAECHDVRLRQSPAIPLNPFRGDFRH